MLDLGGRAGVGLGVKVTDDGGLVSTRTNQADAVKAIQATRVALRGDGLMGSDGVPIGWCSGSWWSARVGARRECYRRSVPFTVGWSVQYGARSESRDHRPVLRARSAGKMIRSV